MNNLRYYQSVYPDAMGQEMYFDVFEQMENPEAVTAQVIQYGAVNANTEQSEEAWSLLKYILDAPVSMDFSKYDTQTVYYAPVSVSAYEDGVVQLEEHAGQGPGKQVSPLNEENAQSLRALPQRVAEGTIPNPNLGAIVQECMEPYLIGEQEFDTCYQELERKLTLYLDE